MRRSYLDTSVIRKRLSGTNSEIALIGSRIESTFRLTSKYVKQEFLKGHFLALTEILSALLYYKKLQDKWPNTTIDDAFKRLSNTFSPRALKTYYVALLEDFLNLPDRKDFDAALLRCRRYLKSQFFIFAGSYFSRYDLNNINCYFQDEEPDFASNTTMQALEKHFSELAIRLKKDASKECNAKALLGANKAQILSLCASPKSVLDETKKTELTGLVTGKVNLTCARCKKFADLFVTLECPDYAILFSVDAFFTETCPSFKKKYTIVPMETSLITGAMIKEKKLPK